MQRVALAVARSYRIERMLGRGGTAAVFLAHDVKHDRPVAMKMLLPDVAATIGTDRFLSEIRLSARLTHPHILPLLDSGTADGLPYFVMPFVRDESLRDLLARNRTMSYANALAVVVEVADALDYAHAAGIIHRDVKPENILMLGGHGVLADFGVARAMSAAGDQRLTATGMSLGTPAYMSPEQAAGEEQLDGRCDQYALATVLFEMLTGAVPFKGATAQQTIALRFMGPAPSIRERIADVPETMELALARALCADPRERFEGIRPFVAALTGDVAATLRRPSPRATSPSAVTEPQSADDRPSVAVMPFTNASTDPDMEFFSDGVTDGIVGVLGRIRNLRVAARGSCYALRAEDVRVVGERLGVASVLEGAVQRTGTRARVSAHLSDARSGTQLWSENYDRELDDVFAIQDDVSHRIAETLRVQLLGDAERRPAALGATNAAAHDAFLRGRYSLNTRTEAGIRGGLEFFNEAIAADPEFAAAFVGRAESLMLMAVYGIGAPSDVVPRARIAAEDALRRDPSLADAYVTLGTVRALYDWDFTAADEAFRRALALSPQLPSAYQRRALDTLVPRGQFDEAIAAIDQASALDPYSSVMTASAGIVRYFAGDVGGALERLRGLAASDPGFAMTHFFLGTVLRDEGELDAALDAFRRAGGAAGGTPEIRASLAQTYAKMGRLAEAVSIRSALLAEAASRWISPCLMAQVDLALGDKGAALDWLPRAEEARDPELVNIGVRPTYRALRGSPGYDRLCERMAGRRFSR
jgi:serine/threonine-protein kinase